MNRFRKSKKKEEPAAQPDEPALFKKNKKVEPEEFKLPIDLSNALPSTDDFRTSLLLPKLSARFSMLREQDDPNTKVGKASDDSVLSPNRASRMNVLGHTLNQLADIDEVASVDGRPSFSLGRADSFASGGDGYGTDDDNSHAGSVMNRPRRGEGNNLFGGRQKVYKIPVKPSLTSPQAETMPSSLTTTTTATTATTATPRSTTGMGGRAVYENDLAMSAFQRQRQRERAELLENEALQQSDAAQDKEHESSSVSSLKRTTYSSTASAPYNSRSSTAATSIDEQPFSPQASLAASTFAAENNQAFSARPGPNGLLANERGPIKSRRLYGQGLTQATQGQQSSALHRLEGLNRQRAATPELPRLSRTFSKSATNLYGRSQKLGATDSIPSGPNSPSSSVASPLHLTADTDSRAAANALYSPASAAASFGSAPPLSPPASENEDGAALAAAVKPQDQGKATAMGLFNKPRGGAFDEQQFTNRQLQMYQGRNTPPLRQPSSPGRGASIDSNRRPKESSRASFRSKTDSIASHHSNTGRSQRADRFDALDSGPTSPVATAAGGTFFANFSGSESGDEADERFSMASQPTSLQSTGASSVVPSTELTTTTTAAAAAPKAPRQHRNNNPGHFLPEVRFPDVTTTDLKPIEENDHTDVSLSPSEFSPGFSENPDSPTLGPSGLGLNGLIRTHLRHDSDKSSIYPPPSPGLPLSQIDHIDSIASYLAETPGPYSYDQTFEDASPPAQHWDNEPRQSTETFQGVSSTTSPQRSLNGGGRDPSQFNGDGSSSHRALAAVAYERRDPPNNASVPEDLVYIHKREPSAETLQEREEFENKLAERRRKVQESLKGFAESESRSGSPSATGRRFPEPAPIRTTGNAFSILKNKPRKNYLINRQESKSARILGLDNVSSSSPTMVSDSYSRRDDEEEVDEEDEAAEEGGGQEQEDRLPLGIGKLSSVIPSSSSSSSTERSLRSRLQSIGRTSQDDSNESSRSRGQSPQSSFNVARDRSGSDASGRSKSRSRYRDRDDLETVDEGVQIAQVAQQTPRDSRGDARGDSPSIQSSTHTSIDGNDNHTTHTYVHNNNNNNINININTNTNTNTAIYDRIPSSASSSGRFRSGSRSAAPSGFLDPPSAGTASMIGAAPRPSPSPSPIASPFSANAAPPLYDVSPEPPSLSAPPPAGFMAAAAGAVAAGNSHAMPQRTPGSAGLQKRAIDKSKISEPTLISSTSNVPLVGLPPGASLSNGMETPPVPPMNPRRRRQTTTQTILGALKGEKSDSRHHHNNQNNNHLHNLPQYQHAPSPTMPTAAITTTTTTIITTAPSSARANGAGLEYRAEPSTFSDDGDDGGRRSKFRNRLRKSSSEGGSLNARMRQEIMASPSPTMPMMPKSASTEGGMF